MAFENLAPYRDEIVSLRRPGANQKKLYEVCDILRDRHGLITTTATVSRYLSHLKADGQLRAPTDAEREQIDVAALLTEVLTEIRGRSEEQRLAIEHLAGQLRINTGSIEELEKAITRQPSHADGANAISPAIIRQIWMRAFLVSLLVVGGIGLAAYWLLGR